MKLHSFDLINWFITMIFFLQQFLHQSELKTSRKKSKRKKYKKKDWKELLPSEVVSAVHGCPQ